jgi:hypothetical protein
MTAQATWPGLSRAAVSEQFATFIRPYGVD